MFDSILYFAIGFLILVPLPALLVTGRYLYRHRPTHTSKAWWIRVGGCAVALLGMLSLIFAFVAATDLSPWPKDYQGKAIIPTAIVAGIGLVAYLIGTAMDSTTTSHRDASDQNQTMRKRHKSSRLLIVLILCMVTATAVTAVKIGSDKRRDRLLANEVELTVSDNLHLQHPDSEVLQVLGSFYHFEGSHRHSRTAFALWKRTVIDGDGFFEKGKIPVRIMAFDGLKAGEPMRVNLLSQPDLIQMKKEGREPVYQDGSVYFLLDNPFAEGGLERRALYLEISVYPNR
jgi:hypothetical protein